MWRLDNSLGFLMVRTARSLKRSLDARLLEHNLTATQYVVLGRLWEEDGISLTELGERLYLDNPTLTGVVDRMERDGLLQRQRDDDDRRVVKVHLTAKGRILRDLIGDLGEQTDAEAWEGFTESQRKKLLNQLDRIWEKLNGRLD
ncbi:MAG: MarR family winged helix-turn-helix transcriptional regulator [Anaerolineales bacterium]